MLGELLEEAAVQAAESGQRSNMGRLTYGPTVYIHWNNGSRIEVDKAQYATLKRNERSAEVVIRVDVQELNPELTWTYERKVRVNSTDWFEHWRKSIIEVFDLESQVDQSLSRKERDVEVGKLAAKKMLELAGQYVLVNDVPQEKQNDPDKVYRTPELAEVYDSKEACFAAYEARFGQAPAGGTTASAPAAPEGFGSYAEFAETVQLLRGEQMDNRAIAEELGVPLLTVAKVQ
jgi:hypothetical protein